MTGICVATWPETRLENCAARLARGECPVILARTDSEDAAALISAPIFPPDELARAARFRFQRNRAELLLARAIVRTVLGETLGLPPLAVPFAGAAGEKPALSGHGSAPIDVSISHSGGWVACGFAPGRAIGVDIEIADGGRDFLNLLSYALSDSERAMFAALDPAAQEPMFYEIWRRKEAVLKGAGVGLAARPTAFSVIGTGPDGTPAAMGTMAFAGRSWRVESYASLDHPPVAVALSADGAG
jgi:4'-phosphopantetheinyl transferase